MDARKTIRLHEGSAVPKPPTFATPARKALHLVLSMAGWVLFVYWWWIVMHDVSRQIVQFTGLFLLISLVFVIGSTLFWSWHNMRLFDRKGPRTQLREVIEDYADDAIGRTVRFEGARARIQSEPEVEVAFDDLSKTYRPLPASWAHGSSESRGGEAS